MVPGLQNSQAGTDLNLFYQQNRVINGDTFLVHIVS
jgi:hypothetical protein